MTEELKIRITAEVNKLKQGVQEAKKAVDRFTEGAEQGASEMDEAFKAVGDSIGNNLKSAAAVGAQAFAALGAALVGTSALTTEYRQNQAQLNAAFEQAGFSASSASSAYNDLYKVIGDSDQATESAANIAMLADSEKEVAQWAELASGVLGTFHDTLQPEAFYEAANETMKLGEATGAFTQMLEQTGVMSVDEFNKKLSACKNTTEKQNLMLQVSQKAMGSAGASYDKATANIQKQREAQEKLTKALAKVGETIAPVITAFTEFAANALAVVAPYIQQFAEEYFPVLAEVLRTTADIVKEVLGYLVENWEMIAGIAAVIGGIATAVGLYNTVAAVKAAMAAAEVTTVWALVAAYAAQAAAMIVAIAPYVLIVAAIAAVIAIIVLCVKHWDTIKEKTAEVMEKIKNAISSGVEKIKGFASGLWTNFKEGAKGAWEGIKSVFSGVANWFKNIFTSAWQGVKNVFSAGGKIFDGIKEGIANTFKTVVNGIISGINRVIKVPFDAINGMLNKIRNITFLDISPFKSLWKQNPLTVPQIPQLAKGGIIDSATLAVIGEQGKEAIVPLENNLEWIDKLANRLATKTGSSRPVVLNVDGKVFAQTTIDTVNELTRQTGSLKLNIM